MDNVSTTARLIALAREIAVATLDFQVVKGPGVGDHATAAFMRDLRARCLEEFGVDLSEKRLCGDTALAVDFYIPDEGTIIEVALGLPNPASEYEKDILKAIMAQDHGFRVSRLVFISRPGACKKCDQPGRSAMVKWAIDKHQLTVEVHDLPGEPRRRIQSSRAKRTSTAIATPAA